LTVLTAAGPGTGWVGKAVRLEQLSRRLRH